MIGIIQNWYRNFEDVADHRMSRHFLMSSIWPILTLGVLFYYFIYYGGRQFMKNRKPYNLKKVIIAYNIFQVVANLLIFLKGMEHFHRLFPLTCLPLDLSEDPKTLEIIQYSAYYFYLKVLDWMDTIFFVLTKKYDHISFLHVYHHILMAVVGWFVVKIAPGGHLYYVGLLNAFVHVVMYGYYALAAADATKSTVAPYKKYVTQVQLGQFVILAVIFTYAATLPSSCTVHWFGIYLTLTQAFMMIALFGNFYYKTYIKPARAKSH